MKMNMKEAKEMYVYISSSDVERTLKHKCIIIMHWGYVLNFFKSTTNYSNDV